MCRQGDLQETTRLIGEVPSVSNMLGKEARSIQTQVIKNWIIFFLKLEKLVEPVIDIGNGREFQILGPWFKYCKLLKISTTVMSPIRLGCSS